MRTLIPFWFILFFLTCSIQVNSQWQFNGSPETGRVLCYASDGSRIYLCATSGLFYSDDAGGSWSSLPLPDNIFTANEVYADGSHLYLASRHKYFDFIPWRFYRSDDLGLTWKSIFPFSEDAHDFLKPLITGDTVVIFNVDSMAVSKDRGDTFDKKKISIEADKAILHKGKLFVVYDENLYESPDLGLTWGQIYTSNDSMMGLDVISINSSLFIIEGYVNNLNTTFLISRSDNGGASWSVVGILDEGNFPLFPSCIGDGNDLFISSPYEESYLFHSSDGGAQWNRINHDFNAASFSYLNGILLAQGTDHVILSSDHGSSFEKHDTGFNAANIIQITAANHKIWVNSNELMYENYNSNQWSELTEFRNIERTDDGELMAIVNDTLKHSPDGGDHWYTIPLSLFGSNALQTKAEILAAGTMFFVSDYRFSWYTHDHGITWQKFDALVVGQEKVTHVAYDQHNYIVSGDKGTLLKSVDGVQWENINYGNWDPLMISNKMVHCHNGYFFTRDTWSTYRLSPGQNEWMYYPLSLGFTCMASYGHLLIGGIYGQGVFLSKDNGDSWTAINYGLTDFQVRVIKVIDDKLYLGVDGGVWVRAISDLDLFPYEGIVFNDENANGLQDPGESGLGSVLVSMHPDQIITSTSNNGHYFLFNDASVQDTISANSPSVYALVTTPPLLVSAPANQLNIGFHFIPGIYDASIFLTNLTPPVPGYKNGIVLTYKNNGTETRDIEIHFTIPQDVQYLSASIDPIIDSDTLIWTIPSVIPGTTGSIIVSIKILTNVLIGSMIDFSSNIPVLPVGDENVLDNTAILSLIVVSSYDPNNKTVFPDGIITSDMIADTQSLEYTIRFQNTGNFPASFIRIQDTLSSNVDLASLKIITASHIFTWKLLPHRVLDIYFQNINLPDSTNDEPGSHGFIKYSVKVKPTLRILDRIENTSYIYFDYNSSIATNTVGSMVGLGTGIKGTGKTLSFSLSPMPVKDFLNITINDPDITGNIHFILYDLKGSVIKSQIAISSDNIRMDVRNIPSSIYFLQATSGNHQSTIKLIKN